MGTDTMWEREAQGAPAEGTAVPLRRVIGPSPSANQWSKLAMSAVAAFGWVFAGAMVFGGGFMLWQLLFGDSVGGDVWLGEPAAWVEEQAAGSDDDLPGGVPWSPDMLDRSTTDPAPSSSASVVPLVPQSDLASTAAAAVAAASNVTTSSTTIVEDTVAQAPAAVSTTVVAAPPATVRPTSPTTVTTVANTVPSTTVATTVTSTTIDDNVTSTTVEDVTSTTIDDSTATTVDDNDGSGRRNRGGGGG